MNLKYDEIIKSVIGGQMAEGTFLFSGYIMDKYINPDISNFIALLIGGIVNFLFQKNAFLSKGILLTQLMVIKYIIVDIILYVYSEYAFVKLQSELDIGDTYLRLIIGGIGFLIISYPMRKYFAFAS